MAATDSTPTAIRESKVLVSGEKIVMRSTRVPAMPEYWRENISGGMTGVYEVLLGGVLYNPHSQLLKSMKIVITRRLFTMTQNINVSLQRQAPCL